MQIVSSIDELHQEINYSCFFFVFNLNYVQHFLFSLINSHLKWNLTVITSLLVAEPEVAVINITVLVALKIISSASVRKRKRKEICLFKKIFVIAMRVIVGCCCQLFSKWLEIKTCNLVCFFLWNSKIIYREIGWNVCVWM